MISRLLTCLAALALASPTAAQTPPASQTAPVRADPAFEARARELVAILSGIGSYGSFFSPGFQAKVPKAKFDAINVQLLAANGPVVGVEGIEPASPWSGTVRVNY